MTNYGINQIFGVLLEFDQDFKSSGHSKTTVGLFLEGEVWTQPLGAGLHGDLHEHGFI